MELRKEEYKQKKIEQGKKAYEEAAASSNVAPATKTAAVRAQKQQPTKISYGVAGTRAR